MTGKAKVNFFSVPLEYDLYLEQAGSKSASLSELVNFYASQKHFGHK